MVMSLDGRHELVAGYCVAVKPDELGASLAAYEEAFPQLVTFRLCVAFGHEPIKLIPLEIRRMIEIALIESHKDVQAWAQELECFETYRMDRKSTKQHFLTHSIPDADKDVLSTAFAQFTRESCQDCIVRASQELGIHIFGKSKVPSFHEAKSSDWIRCSCLGFRCWFDNKYCYLLREAACHAKARSWHERMHEYTLFSRAVLQRFGLQAWCFAFDAPDGSYEGRTTARVYLASCKDDHQHSPDPSSDESPAHSLMELTINIPDNRDRIKARLVNFTEALTLTTLDPNTLEKFVEPKDIKAVFKVFSMHHTYCKRFAY